MNAPESPKSDPRRLEEGLARLRELGYLQTPEIGRAHV